MNNQDPFTVIYEDNHLLIVNKRAGILVQGDETRDMPLVELCKTYIGKKYGKPGAVFLGVVHRLDRPVSGIVVLARTSKSLERMNRLFRERQTIKTYWAVVAEKPREGEGTLVHWLLKDENKNKATVFSYETKGALRSELSYRIIAGEKGLYLLEVNPLTGRSHQIRAQLAAISCPIVGDVKYGYAEPNEDGSICLHARRIEFIHPVKKESLKAEAPVPRKLCWNIFKNL